MPYCNGTLYVVGLVLPWQLLTSTYLSPEPIVMLVFVLDVPLQVGLIIGVTRSGPLVFGGEYNV